MLTILTQYDETYSSLAELTSPTKRRYAAIYGYTFTEVQGFGRKDIPVNWQKIPTILSALDSSEWVMWSDADSAIMNPSIDVLSLAGDDDEIVVGMHIIDYGQKNYVLHGGNILFKSTTLVRDFLCESLDMYGKVRQDRLMEELAYIAVWKSRMAYRKIAKLVKLSSLCTIPRHTAYMRHIVGFDFYSPGDFVIHSMAPLTYQERMALAWRYLGNMQ